MDPLVWKEPFKSLQSQWSFSKEWLRNNLVENFLKVTPCIFVIIAVFTCRCLNTSGILQQICHNNGNLIIINSTHTLVHRFFQKLQNCETALHYQKQIWESLQLLGCWAHFVILEKLAYSLMTYTCVQVIHIRYINSWFPHGVTTNASQYFPILHVHGIFKIISFSKCFCSFFKSAKDNFKL